ncbi:hypothetical protein RND81_04G081700 [Saponaria officinalis]|uniref:Transposase n=1 Tax=Saponaria officinalis TaxID=3572 RepID=A0AAW1LJU8_SAPOF
MENIFPTRIRSTTPTASSITLRDPSSKNNPTLTEKEKNEISLQMHLHCHHGNLEHGFLKELESKYGVSRWTIHRLWKVVHQSIVDGEAPYLKPKFKGSINSLALDIEKVRNADLSSRMNLNGLACILGCSYSTAQRSVCKGKVRSHTNAVKPLLSKENMENRLKFVLSKIKPESLPQNPTFEGMYDYVHIDEKWFYMTRTFQRYYLLPEEENPHRTCKSKKFIEKIMFMAAVARPRFDSDGTCTFNGKIGIFPFSVEVPAQRASKNRARGVLVTKPIESITKEVVKQYLLQKVIPAIKDKWPAGSNKHIIIQQDNAKTHISGDDPEFLKVAQADGFDIVLQCQPSNSPDLNINDLGFFRVIQTIQHEKSPKTVRELINAVEVAFNETNDVTLNYVWLSLMFYMNEILSDKGNNKYKLPHMNKKRLSRLGILPTHVCPNKEVVLERLAELQEQSDIGQQTITADEPSIGNNIDVQGEA